LAHFFLFDFVPSGRYIIIMAKRQDGTATREKILSVTAKLIAASGPAELTIEKAAQAASLSKGAVLYHFPSKDALVSALITASLEKFDATTTRFVERDATGKGRFTRAYANVLFHPQNNTAEFAAGLLAAVTTNLSLLEPAVSRHADIQRRIEDDGISASLATLIRLAADGLYFTRAFGLAPPSDAQAEGVLKLLLEMSQSEVTKKGV
jgi:AcrR family transcriptional regulator